MVRYILLSILLSVFIIACADTDTVAYDYNNEDVTVGLTVSPSNNALTFTSNEVDTAKKFSLTVDTNELTFLGIDNESENYSNGGFVNDPKFNFDTCRQQIASFTPCEIFIKMTNTASVGSSGYIKLKFIYNKDDKAEPGSFKYHKLNFTYDGSK